MYFIITYYCLQHKSPDYSAVYIVFETDGLDNIEGHGLTFTLGRGNELGMCIASIWLFHCTNFFLFIKWCDKFSNLT